MDTHDGARLRAWRQNLPRVGSGEISARSVALSLGWQPDRWSALERSEKWDGHQRQDVADAARAVLARLGVAGDAAELHASHLTRGGAVQPMPTEWLEGQCPAVRRGRPAGRPAYRGSSRDSGKRQPADKRADLVLTMLLDGQIDQLSSA